MKIDWLEDMLAILVNKSIGEAARARLLTQPAFSRRIKALEVLLGFDIIDRRHRPARPSHSLLVHEGRIREAAASMRQLIADLRRQGQQGDHLVEIASQHAITTSYAASIVAALNQRHRGRIHLISANRSECYAMLFSKQVALIFTYQLAATKVDASDSFSEDIQIGTDRLMAVFERRKAAAILAQTGSSDLPIIAYPPNIFLGNVLQSEILPSISPVWSVWPAVETAIPEVALQLSRAGLGIAWVPQSLARPDLHANRLTDLSAVLPSVPVNLLVRRLAGPKTAVEEDLWSVFSSGTFRT